MDTHQDVLLISDSGTDTGQWRRKGLTSVSKKINVAPASHHGGPSFTPWGLPDLTVRPETNSGGEGGP